MGTKLLPKHLILLVDDFPEQIDDAALLLQDRGAQAAIALTAEDGISQARLMRPDVVVFDLALPGIDGLRAAMIMRADPSTRAIPLILNTRHTSAELEVLARRAGFDAVVAKEAGAGVLLDVIEGLLTGEQPMPAAGIH